MLGGIRTTTHWRVSVTMKDSALGNSALGVEWQQAPMTSVSCGLRRRAAMKPIRTEQRVLPNKIHKAVRLKFSPERGKYLAVVQRKVDEAEAAGVVLR